MRLPAPGSSSDAAIGIHVAEHSGSIVTRRWLVALAGAGLVAGRVPAVAQGASLPTVGFIAFASREAALIEAFEKGLAEHGRLAGSAVRVVEVYGDGSPERAREKLAALVAAGTRVFVAAGGNASRMVQQLAPDAKVVVASLEGLAAAGVAGTIARPAGNVTGFATLAGELIGKRLEVLREILPGLGRVALVTNPANRNHPALIAASRAAAGLLGVEIAVVEVRSRGVAEVALGRAKAEGAGAALFVRDFLFESMREELVAASAAAGLASVFDEGEYVRLGGLLSYSPSRPDLFRRAAAYVVRIFDGAEPRDLPIQQPTRFEMVVNLGTARALGLRIPDAVLIRADEVIE
jgi:putative ABC transport system substrate-binding protein